MKNYTITPPTKEEVEQISKTAKSHTSPRKCILCGAEFDWGKKSGSICHACKILVICPQCGKEFYLDLFNYSGTKQNTIIDAILNDRPIEAYCGKQCSYYARKVMGVCSQCGGYSLLHGISKLCEECHADFCIGNAQNLMKEGYCTNVDCLTPKIFRKRRAANGYCRECKLRMLKRARLESNKTNTSAGNCLFCGQYVEKRNPASGFCNSCQILLCQSNIQLNESEGKCTCPTCLEPNKIFKKRNAFGMCQECADKQRPRGRIQTEILMKATSMQYDTWYLDKRGEKRESLPNGKLGIPLKISDIHKLQERPGVWALWGTPKDDVDYYVCLTVGQSVNVESELNSVNRILKNKRLKGMEEQKKGSTGGWYEIQERYEDFCLFIVCIDETSKPLRELYEASYAFCYNSIFWKPSVTQMGRNFIRDMRLFVESYQFEDKECTSIAICKDTTTRDLVVKRIISHEELVNHASEIPILDSVSDIMLYKDRKRLISRAYGYLEKGNVDMSHIGYAISYDLAILALKQSDGDYGAAKDILQQFQNSHRQNDESCLAI